MARDIEEFLRQAAERRKKQQQGQNSPPLVQRPRVKSRQRDVYDAEIVEPEVIEDDIRSGSLQSHVQEHLSTREIADHAQHLSDRIRQADERVERQVHEHLDHQLGQLENNDTITDDQLAQSAALDISPVSLQLIQMLSSPESVRQAILVAEILRRPSFDD